MISWVIRNLTLTPSTVAQTLRPADGSPSVRVPATRGWASSPIDAPRRSTSSTVSSSSPCPRRCHRPAQLPSGSASLWLNPPIRLFAPTYRGFGEHALHDASGPESRGVDKALSRLFGPIPRGAHESGRLDREVRAHDTATSRKSSSFAAANHLPRSPPRIDQVQHHLSPVLVGISLGPFPGRSKGKSGR